MGDGSIQHRAQQYTIDGCLSPTIVEAETVIIGRDAVEPNNTCPCFNNSSCWVRCKPSIVLLLHFEMNKVRTKEKFEYFFILLGQLTLNK